MVPKLNTLAAFAEGLGFGFQHPHVSQPPITPLPGDLLPSSGLLGHSMYLVHIYTDRQTLIKINVLIKTYLPYVLTISR